MNEYFLHFDYAQTLYKQLHALKQEGKFIDNYTNKFYQLEAKNALAEIQK
jgi:biotin operon repressor